MKKTILKAALISLVLAAPVAVFAGSMTGNCVDCHTMHGSQDGNTSATNDNLLKLDCISCHTTTDANSVASLGTSSVPQVAHQDTTDLAGGNFRDGMTAGGGSAHNVADLFGASGVLEANLWATNGDATYGAPPGNNDPTKHGATFTTDANAATDFDKFTCAGVAGCHGTRAQLVELDNGDAGGDRTGLTAVTGAHHASTEEDKTSTGYTVKTAHSGTTVAAGYRFIPGLKGKGNATTRWTNVDASNHNEYFGSETALNTGACTTCHIADNTSDPELDKTTTLKVPNNSMSGFCSTCHGNFHSSGTENGTSGAFTRHPSDYVIPNSGEYSSYTTYELTAPVARPDISAATANTVAPGTDMVMCLSCHNAHASANTYLLKFDYTDMWAGSATAGQDGTGCLACHTTKG